MLLSLHFLFLVTQEGAADRLSGLSNADPNVIGIKDAKERATLKKENAELKRKLAEANGDLKTERVDHEDTKVCLRSRLLGLIIVGALISWY